MLGLGINFAMVGPIIGVLQASQDMVKDFNEKFAKVWSGEYFENIKILGDETVDKIKKNENKLWEGVKQIEGAEAFLGNPQESRRELILIKGYQTLLVIIDFVRVLYSPKE